MEIGDYQLRRSWERRATAASSSLTKTTCHCPSRERRGSLWETPVEFARFLRHCLQRAPALRKAMRRDDHIAAGDECAVEKDSLPDRHADAARRPALQRLPVPLRIE